MNIIQWFNKAFGVKKRRGDELNTFCPKCNHKDFHFNIKSKVGFCHRAACHWSPSFEELCELAGYSPDEVSWMPDRVEEQRDVEVSLPGTPLCFFSLDKLMTHSQDALNYILGRGITIDDILRFKMTYDGERVYVPIMKEGRLYNYVGRDLTGMSDRKYKYAAGVKTSHWIFGWDECKEWDWITLVENTFVSISLRNSINSTTNFGSYLSDVQIDLLKKSKIKTVVIMWDEGTAKNAEKIVKKLRSNGIYAAFCWMKRQPDDHPKEQIIEIAHKLKQFAEQNITEYDPFNIKKEKL